MRIGFADELKSWCERVGLLEQDISRLQREVNESFTRLLEQTDVAASMPDRMRRLHK